MPKYLGIIGDPIHHSLSPIMHNAALIQQKIDMKYLPFRVTSEELATGLKGLKALNFVGFNVTVPHKVAIIPFLDELSYEATLIGAVNTVHILDGRLVGYNTDGIGFVHSLKKDGQFNPLEKRIVILGAGGAARAVAVQLGLEGAAEITIANRTILKAESLVKELASKIPDTLYQGVGIEVQTLKNVIGRADLIVNATPLGMISYKGPAVILPEKWLNKDQLVGDLVYNPRLTPLLKTAQKVGAQILSGEGMLLYQGVEAYRIWTGVEPPIELMREVLLSALRKNDEE